MTEIIILDIFRHKNTNLESKLDWLPSTQKYSISAKDTQKTLAAVEHGHPREEASQFYGKQSEGNRQRHHQPGWKNKKEKNISGCVCWHVSNVFISGSLTFCLHSHTVLVWNPKANKPWRYFPVKQTPQMRMLHYIRYKQRGVKQVQSSPQLLKTHTNI